VASTATNAGIVNRDLRQLVSEFPFTIRNSDIAVFFAFIFGAMFYFAPPNTICRVMLAGRRRTDGNSSNETLS
jgi:hypothetical protein